VKLRVCTANILSSKLVWGEQWVWDHRRTNLAHTLNELELDVICMQEVRARRCWRAWTRAALSFGCEALTPRGSPPPQATTLQLEYLAEQLGDGYAVLPGAPVWRNNAAGGPADPGNYDHSGMHNAVAYRTRLLRPLAPTTTT
jgi:hypothetical protein